MSIKCTLQCEVGILKGVNAQRVRLSNGRILAGHSHACQRTMVESASVRALLEVGASRDIACTSHLVLESLVWKGG